MTNKSFENYDKVQYLGTIISQNYTKEENNSFVRLLDSCVDILIEVKVEILNLHPLFMLMRSFIYFTVDAQNVVDGCLAQTSAVETRSDLKELGIFA